MLAFGAGTTGGRITGGGRMKAQRAASGPDGASARRGEPAIRAGISEAASDLAG